MYESQEFSQAASVMEDALLNKNELLKNEHEFMQMVISKLGTCLSSPEEEIVVQDERGAEMFFIAKGDCVVNLNDAAGVEHRCIRLLVEGDHFGEISLVYRCNRTASVVSRNYNTMARLGYANWREVVNEYPKYLKLLKKHLYRYNDVKKQFFKQLICRVFYFAEGLTQDMFHDLIYKLVPKQYEKGQILLKEYSNANSLLFVEYGLVEVFFELEGNEFIVDNLHPGSVINYRSFFMEDLMHVTMRCKENTRILELTKKTFEKMREENAAFETRILMHQSQILRWNKKYPLDYIINVPEHLRDRRISSELLKNMLRRRNIFKNIVFRRLSEVREMRKKPKLKQIKAACLARFGALDGKEVLKRKLVQLYKK